MAAFNSLWDHRAIKEINFNLKSEIKSLQAEASEDDQCEHCGERIGLLQHLKSQILKKCSDLKVRTLQQLLIAETPTFHWRSCANPCS
jgi:hypothetical protein